MSFQLISRKYDRLIAMIFFSTLLLMSSVVAYSLVRSHQQFLDYHEHISQLTTVRLASELGGFFSQQQQLASLMVTAHQPVFDRWVSDPDDATKRYALAEVIKKYFPDQYSFTLANDDGNPIWDDMGETIGEACLNDLKAHSLSATLPNNSVSYIHPGSQNYHFDLFTTITHKDQKKVLLISFKPDQLALMLSSRQMPDHHLFLVRNDLPDLIEISMQGSRDKMIRDAHFSQAEVALLQTRYATKQAIRNTNWLLIDITDENTLKSAQYKLWVELLALLFMVVVVVKWRLLHRQRQEQLAQSSLLVEMNQKLEQKVKDRTQQIERQQHQLKLAAQVFSASTDGIIICDENNRIVDVNDALIVLTGYKRHDLIGENPRIFSSHTMKQDFYENMWHSINQNGYWHGEIDDFTSKNKVIHMRCAISSVKNEQGKVVNYIAIYSDIGEIKAAQKALESMAYHDALTGLANRALLFDRLEQYLALNERQKTIMALCYLDLDGFKPINDTLGHAAGDKLLKTVAERLEFCLRSSDTAARLGGDEFVVLFSGLSSQDECEIALKRIMAHLSLPIELGTQQVYIGASIGVSLFPQDGTTSDVLLQNADKAMYQVKNTQKNGYAFFSSCNRE